jgi:tRNA U38,U39,U40 pseudouridine synthase TruA
VLFVENFGGTNKTRLTSFGYETQKLLYLRNPSNLEHQKFWTMATTCRRKDISVLLGCVLLCCLSLPIHVISFSVTRENRQNAAASTATKSHTLNAPSLPHECHFCSVSFASRNALFRHLGENPSCASNFKNTDAFAGNVRDFEATRLSLVVRIAYFCQANENGPQNATQRKEQTSEAREIGKLVQKAIAKSLLDICGGGRVTSSTQTSVARQRHRALSQENGLSSVGDVMVLNVRIPSGKYESPTQFSSKLLETANRHLQDTTDDAPTDHFSIRLVAGTTLPSDRTFHAEQDCTQRIYHYLLPLSWLPDGEKLESWWLQHNPPHPEPPSDSLRRLREALKSAESKTIPNRRVRRRSGKPTTTTVSVNSSNNRVGAFANKDRHPWHNFADQELRGDASPNQEPVWRVLDKARIQGFLTVSGKDEVVAILEFRGDDFVPGQIRSIVGTALAITHGWLPANTFQAALSKDTFLETASAPEGRLYNAGARFHFHEKDLASSGDPALLSLQGTSSQDSSLKWLQDKMMRQLSAANVEATEQRWLWDLEHVVAPRISQAMETERTALLVSRTRKSTAGPSASTLLPLDEILEDNVTALHYAYQKTLSLLRDVVASGSWPETSVARSGVIREDTPATAASAGQAGSFTVFNTRVPDNHLIHQAADELPIGNTAFPKLTEAAFELEAAMAECSNNLCNRANMDGSLLDVDGGSKKSLRPASLCCAINSNAQFRPHVDSGRGAGQSLSMIVGLGDYTGGELFVEGISHDIRYKPLEFDGWSSRHWTNHYVGERFSLVWFSPEAKKAG